MNSFQIMLEAELGGYEKTEFKGRPAIALFETDKYRYLLISNPKMVNIEDLHKCSSCMGAGCGRCRDGKRPSYIAVEQIGKFRPARTMSLAYRHYMKQTGRMTVSPGRAPTPSHERIKRHFGDATIRIKFLDDGMTTSIKRPLGTKVPLLTVISKEAIAAKQPTQPPERKRRRGKRGGRKHRERERGRREEEQLGS